jgi:predicted P-loop ATPase/GTPase
MSSALAPNPTTEAAEFLANMIVIDSLLDVVRTSDVERFRAGQSDVRLKRISELLTGPESLVALQIWAHRYAQPLELMRTFRNGYVHGAPSSTRDLQELAEASRTTIQAAIRRLERQHSGH